MSIAHHIYKAWGDVLTENDSVVNLSRLSQLIGTRVATVWAYHHGKAKWPADIWLLSLILTGAAKVEGDTVTIKIGSPVLDPEHPIGFAPEVLKSNRKAKKKAE